MSLRRKKKNKHNSGANTPGQLDEHNIPIGVVSSSHSGSLGRVQARTDSPSSKHSMCSDRGSNPSLSRKTRHKKSDDIEMGIKHVEVVSENITLHTVEVLKRPGQTLGFYIREGNGKTAKKGVFISRIAEGSVVQQNGLLRTGDEIQAINSVDVTRTNLDDVVVLMSIPKKLILTIRSHRPPQRLSGGEYGSVKPVYIQKQLSDDTESIRRFREAADLHTEDSNDSGLSSENSLKGDRLIEPVPQLHSQLLTTISPYHVPSETVYARPKAPKTELYASDCEHEYSAVPRISNFAQGGANSKLVSYGQKFRSQANCDAYNSDSELLPRSNHSNKPIPQQRQPWASSNTPASINESSYATPKPPGFSSEMQHWLKKFDHTSDNFYAEPRISVPTNPPKIGMLNFVNVLNVGSFTSHTCKLYGSVLLYILCVLVYRVYLCVLVPRDFGLCLCSVNRDSNIENPNVFETLSL